MGGNFIVLHLVEFILQEKGQSGKIQLEYYPYPEFLREFKYIITFVNYLSQDVY